MNKKQCFWLCLGHALLLSAPTFLCAWSGTQVKLHAWKDVFLERNLFNCEAASLISSVFYMLWTIKKRSGSLFRQLWGQNSKTLWIQIFFHLKWDFLWNHFATKKTIINISLTHTNLTKMSDWYFAWKNGYGCRPLLCNIW